MNDGDSRESSENEGTVDGIIRDIRLIRNSYHNIEQLIQEQSAGPSPTADEARQRYLDRHQPRPGIIDVHLHQREEAATTQATLAELRVVHNQIAELQGKSAILISRLFTLNLRQQKRLSQIEQRESDQAQERKRNFLNKHRGIFGEERIPTPVRVRPLSIGECVYIRNESGTGRKKGIIVNIGEPPQVTVQRTGRHLEGSLLLTTTDRLERELFI
jgi:hypothetical protein